MSSYAARVAAREANNAAFEKRVAEMKEIQKQRNNDLEYGRNYTDQEKITATAYYNNSENRSKKLGEERDRKAYNKYVHEKEIEDMKKRERSALEAKMAFYEAHKNYGGGSTRRRTNTRN